MAHDQPDPRPRDLRIGQIDIFAGEPRALAVRARDAVGAGVAAADHDHVLAGGGEGTMRGGNRLVVTYNPFENGCLWIFPDKEWERVRDEVTALPTVKSVQESRGSRRQYARMERN